MNTSYLNDPKAISTMTKLWKETKASTLFFPNCVRQSSFKTLMYMKSQGVYVCIKESQRMFGDCTILIYSSI